MANTVISIRSSGVTGNTPSLGVLANGELSLNFADGILYYKTAANALGSIRTTQPSGLNTEIQFNDSGSFGANAAFTFNKAIATLNVTNINVSSNITTGGGTGGVISGANVIYSNTFSANSTTDATSNITGAIVSAGGLGVKGNVFASNVYVRNDVIVGLQDGNALAGATNPVIAAIANVDSYMQIYGINYSNTANASADVVIYPNNGNDANGWIDMGITSNTFACTSFSITGRNEGYVFMSAPGGSGTSGNLVIATDSTGAYNTIEFVVGGFTKGKTNSNVKITSQTTSTSNTTGSLIVKGGIGVTGNVYADGVYDGGTRVITYTQAAFDKANTDATNISATDGVYGNATHVPVITLAANGRVSSIVNTAISGVGGGGNSFGIIYTSNNTTYANATSSTDQLNFVGEAGIIAFANSLTKTITIAGTPGAQGLTVDYGYVYEAMNYSIDYGTL